MPESVINIIEKSIAWTLENKEWLFSGAFIAVIPLMRWFFKKKKDSPTQKIKSGDNSIIIQAGRDAKIEK